MKYGSLFEQVKPHLDKNDFGMAHTRRVFDIAIDNFDIPRELEELVLTTIVFHDVGGSSVKEQYENGPGIATDILNSSGYDDDFIREVCEIISTHHDHPVNPSTAFKIVYDSDRVAMFSPQEFSHYDSIEGFDWRKVIDSMYTDNAKRLAEQLLERRLDGN